MPGGYHITNQRKEKDTIPSLLLGGEAGNDLAVKPGYREKDVWRQTLMGWSPEMIKDTTTEPSSNDDTNKTTTK